MQILHETFGCKQCWTLVPPAYAKSKGEVKSEGEVKEERRRSLEGHAISESLLEDNCTCGGEKNQYTKYFAVAEMKRAMEITICTLMKVFSMLG
tara:strand:- start:153 stop:434 length:282 start_codon:yes stop_codon:yes gene_type:complete